MPQRTRSQRLNGLFPLSYMGVVPVSPVNFVIDNRPPTVNDYKNFYVGDLWLDVDTNTPPTNEDIWMLVSVASNVATWINLGGGDAETLSGDAGINPVFPDGADNINVFGDNVAGITVSGDGVNTLTVSTTGILAHDYVTDNGTATPVAGVLNIITNQAANNAGATFQFSGVGNTVQLNTTDAANNTFISFSCGNTTLTGTGNVGFAEAGLTALTTGSNNCALGHQAGLALADGSNNISIGKDSAEFLISGTDNVNIGTQAGNAGVANNFNVNIGSQAAALVAGNSNVFIGFQSGVGALFAARNTCIGQESGSALNNSDDNVIIGYQSGIVLTGASTDNVLIGSEVASSLAGAATSNVIIGQASGSAYTTTESDNIIISNAGVIADSATIRIGTFATQARNFQAGISGVSLTLANREFVTINNTTGQLGSDNFSALSWTPGLSFGSGTTGITYSIQEGIYQTLGNIVFFSGGFVLTSKGTATGTARITGLPLAASGVFTIQQAFVSTEGVTFPAGRTVCWAIIGLGVTTAVLNTGGSGVVAATLDDTAFINTSRINVTGFYFRA